MVGKNLEKKTEKKDLFEDLIQLHCADAESDIVVLGRKMTCSEYFFDKRYKDAKDRHRCDLVDVGSRKNSEQCRYASLLEELKKYEK